MSIKTRIEVIEHKAAELLRPFSRGWITPSEQRQLAGLWESVRIACAKPEFIELMVEHMAGQLLELGVLP